MGSALPSERSGGFLLSIWLGCLGYVLDVQCAIGICGDASDAALPRDLHGLVVIAVRAHAMTVLVVEPVYKPHLLSAKTNKPPGGYA